MIESMFPVLTRRIAGNRSIRRQLQQIQGAGLDNVDFSNLAAKPSGQNIYITGSALFRSLWRCFVSLQLHRVPVDATLLTPETAGWCCRRKILRW